MSHVKMQGHWGQFSESLLALTTTPTRCTVVQPMVQEIRCHHWDTVRRGYFKYTCFQEAWLVNVSYFGEQHLAWLEGDGDGEGGDGGGGSENEGSRASTVKPLGDETDKNEFEEGDGVIWPKEEEEEEGQEGQGKGKAATSSTSSRSGDNGGGDSSGSSEQVQPINYTATVLGAVHDMGLSPREQRNGRQDEKKAKAAFVNASKAVGYGGNLTQGTVAACMLPHPMPWGLIHFFDYLEIVDLRPDNRHDRTGLKWGRPPPLRWFFYATVWGAVILFCFVAFVTEQPWPSAEGVAWFFSGGAGDDGGNGGGGVRIPPPPVAPGQRGASKPGDGKTKGRTTSAAGGGALRKPPKKKQQRRRM